MLMKAKQLSPRAMGQEARQGAGTCQILGTISCLPIWGQRATTARNGLLRPGSAVRLGKEEDGNSCFSCARPKYSQCRSAGFPKK